MPIDTRKCFWFGTEERAGFINTPLKGADSSPSAWGVDGTLLNGGGYAFNSFGSHKRYTYEWPQSSSPEAAQLMKSYRDGTYGRGLLYFLDPGIYRTNILPAQWADPSMTLNNEAPSLVYGVTPTAAVTSGGEALGLPVTSASYNLSSVTPQTEPTPEGSLFVPVPTGHTLFLGAFYSATGTAGIYATPVNNNGTMGAAIKLTQKPNSDTSVVTDRISGDIKGVRLWVGRTSAVTSALTITALCARLMDTADTVTYGPWVEQARNVVPDPGFRVAGPTVEVWRNRFNCPAISGTSTTGWGSVPGTGATTTTSNIASITPPPGIPATREIRTNWTSSPTGGFPSANFPSIPATPGETVPYRFFTRRSSPGVLRIRLSYIQADGVTASASADIIQTSPSLPAAGATGSWWEVSGVTPVIPATTAFIRFEVAVASGELPPSTFWIGVTSATTHPLGLIFDGSTQYTPDPDLTPAWSGTVGVSESVLNGVRANGVTVSTEVVAIRSIQNVIEGQYSLRLIARSATSSSGYAALSSINRPAGATRGTFVVYRTINGPITGSVWAAGLGRVYWNPIPQIFSDAAPNVAGTTVLRVYSDSPIEPNSTVILPHGGLIGTSDVYYNLATVVPDMNYLGLPFSGSTPSASDQEQFRWLGTMDASDSVYETRSKSGSSAKEDKVKSGPWIGGQGHSGCRFVGTPSYVNNGPVQGGRVGYAATFAEVGSWVYG